MQMNTMEALGPGPNLSLTGETPGLKLGADAETLALFASLFAMMQTQQQGDTMAGPFPEVHSQSEVTEPVLPAAASLIAELAPTATTVNKEVPLADLLANDSKAVEGERDDAAGLLKLLLAAHEIAAPDQQPTMLAAANEDDITAAAPTRTATEMLTGAIEILKSVEVGATLSGPIEETPDQIATPRAQAMVLQANPDFIGPMPAVTVPSTKSAPAVVMLTDPDFVGLMNGAPSSVALRMPAMVLKANPDFIGPMPAVTPPATLAEQAVLLPVDPDFIGPMPVIGLAFTVQTADAFNAALNEDEKLRAVTHTAAKVPAASQLIGTATHTAEPVSNMATIRAVSAAANFTGKLPDAATPVTGATVYLPMASSGATPASTHGLNPELDVDQKRLVKSSATHVPASEEGADKDEGFVLRRADMLTAAKDLVEKTSIQQKVPDIQTKRTRMMSKATDLAKGSAASATASVQALAQQTAATSQAGNMFSSTSASDNSQNVAAGTAGGQSGGQSGSQQSAQQMADRGMARGAADRTLLHRLNTDNAGWSETMVKRLTADLRSGVQNVRIILEPRQLGRLNVELGLRNGQASIRIAAETQEAAKLLSGARGQLGQMLESAGLRLAGFQATGLPAGDTGLDTGPGSQGRGGEGASDNAGRNNAGRDQDFSNKMATALDDNADDAADGVAAPREGETAVLSILA